MNTKLFYEISDRKHKSEEKLNQLKKDKKFGTIEFASAKTEFETLNTMLNLIYICQ